MIVDRKTRRWTKRLLDSRLAKLANCPKDEIRQALDQVNELEATKHLLWEAEMELKRRMDEDLPIVKAACDLFPEGTDPNLIAESLKERVAIAQGLVPLVQELADGLTCISRSLILFDHNEGAIDNVIADVRKVLQETDDARKQAQTYKFMDVVSSMSKLLGTQQLSSMLGLDGLYPPIHDSPAPDDEVNHDPY